MRRAPTIGDVATRAGVHRVTASVVLNDAPAHTRVSEATRQRVLAAAVELRYQPNAIARSLRRRRTDVVGFYYGENYGNPANPFVAQLVAGLHTGCEQRDKDLLLHNRRPGRSAADVYAEVAGGKIDGLVLYVQPDDPLIAMLAGSHLPVVAVVDALTQLPSVVADDRTGGRLQAEHLAGRGHTRVLYFGPETRPLHASVARRMEGFMVAAGRLGLEVDVTRSIDLSGRAGPEAMRLLQNGTSRPHTAVVAWADSCALSVLAACARLGRRVPEQTAVMGFDGVAPWAEPSAALTTIRAPWQDVARTAVSLVVDRIEGREVAAETVLPVELAYGATT